MNLLLILKNKVTGQTRRETKEFPFIKESVIEEWVRQRFPGFTLSEWRIDR